MMEFGAWPLRSMPGGTPSFWSRVTRAGQASPASTRSSSQPPTRVTKRISRGQEHDMPVPLKNVLDALPPKRRAALDRRFKDLMDEVESLKELRRLSAKSQARIAKTL